MLSRLFTQGNLGIEITTKHIRFVYLVQKDGVFHLRRFGTMAIPQDVFIEGVLQDSSTLEEGMRNIVQTCPAKNIRLCLPVASQKFFSIKLSHNNRKTLMEDIIFHLKEHVLFYEDKDDIVDISIFKKEKQDIHVRVVTAPREIFKTYKNILGVFKGKNMHIDRENQAAIYASFQNKYKQTSYIHVQFGDDLSSYSIIRDGKIVEYKEFPFAVARFLQEVEKRLTKPAGGAGGYLSHVGITGADIKDFSIDSLASVAVLLDHAILEYGRSSREVVAYITLGGVFAGYQGLATFLSHQLRVSVSPSYPWKTFDPRFDDSIFDMKKQETLEYLVALGLALRGGGGR